jgi:hypothetical protein
MVNRIVPTQDELNNSWENLRLKKIDNWTQSAIDLKDRIKILFGNGGIELNKYKIMEDYTFKKIFNGQNFAQNIFKNKQILLDKSYLDIKGEPKIIVKQYFSDIFTLSGDLARILCYGGAYNRGINYKNAWIMATEFVEKEFGNRFCEFWYYKIVIENGDWFYDVAWDYSLIITDITNSEIVFMDITDTD